MPLSLSTGTHPYADSYSTDDRGFVSFNARTPSSSDGSFFIFLLAGNVDRSSYSRKTEDNDRCAVATRLCANETPIARHFTIIVSVDFHLPTLPLSLFVSRVRKLSSCESEHRVELERYVPCGIVLI